MAVTIIADWKIETTCNRSFGVCYIEFSPPYDKFDFNQGFTLPNPTHLRCALQAIISSVEAIRGCAFLRECPCIILATKHELAYNLLTASTSSSTTADAPNCLLDASDNHDMPNPVHTLYQNVGGVRRWLDTGRWPKSQLGNRALLRKAFEMIESLDPKICTFVYVERDDEDSAYVDLDEGRTEEGLDMDQMSKDGKTPVEIEKQLRDTRMRGVMAQKLFGTGARASRKSKKKA